MLQQGSPNLCSNPINHSINQHGTGKDTRRQDHRGMSNPVIHLTSFGAITKLTLKAGLPRTSTTSLKKGLEILGINPCFHLGDPPAPISRVKESARVLAIQDRNERLKALKNLYDGFEAVFEPPASTLVDDMLTIYPNAKVCSRLPR
jgi:hypothetical protein